MTRSLPTSQGGEAVVKVGDWAVFKSWRYDVAQITKVTAKQVRTALHGKRETYHSPSAIVFSGTEKAARDLAAVLTGLDKRQADARRKLVEQQREQIARAVAKASPQGGEG